jgi:hypothetical protein
MRSGMRRPWRCSNEEPTSASFQAFLGHAKLTTTEICTHVAITKLKEVYAQTQLAARFGKPQGGSRKDGPAEVEAAELLATLEAEQAEGVERSGAVSIFDEEPAVE